jgi:hypothetical protein
MTSEREARTTFATTESCSLDPHDSDIGGIFEIVVEMTNRTMNNQESWEVV